MTKKRVVTGGSAYMEPLRGNIHIYFKAGMLQIKSLSPKFAQIPTIRQMTAKNCNRKWKFATGNRN